MSDESFTSLSIEQVLSIQQNRFPNLFIDRVDYFERGSSAVCRKNFTYNEWYFPLHFPDEPIVPGFVILECMTQALLIAILSEESLWGSRTNFLGVEKCRFFAKVVPGDVAIISSEVTSFKRGIAKGRVEMKLEQRLAATCNLSIGLPEHMFPLEREG